MKGISKNFLFSVSVVAIGFFWFGSAFFSYLEVLKANFDAETAAVIITSLSYGAQMLGILFYVLIAARNKKLVENNLVVSSFFILSAVGIIGSLTSSNQAVIIISGVLFNFFGTSGLLLGCQLRCITEKLPQKYYGRAFGFAYAIGSLGTTLLTFAFGGRCPVGYAAVAIYVPIILLNFAMLRYKDKLPNDAAETSLPERADNFIPAAEKPVGKNLILISVGVFLVIGILSTINGLTQNAYLEISGEINTTYIRAFYAVGLIPAGFIIDYSRRMGAIAALAANGLSFLFVLLVITPGRGFEALALNYLLAGFLRVYQVATSMDIARKTQRLFYFSVFGILFNRLGEVIATLPYNYIQFDLLRETMLASTFFVILLLLFFPLMKKLYDPVLPEPASAVPERTLDEMIEGYGFTNRETEVLKLLIRGQETNEIAEAMVITEKSVQNYIGSMLSKTGTKSRHKLTTMFYHRKH